MRDGGRLAAAISVLEDMAARHKPAKQALKTFGDNARFAGAKDRAFVSGLALDALRRRRSTGWKMGADTARAQVIGTLGLDWGWSIDRLAEACADGHGPGALTEVERARLADPIPLDDAPGPVRGDYPDWLDEPFRKVFGAKAAEEGAALSERAPVDLRVNSLKAKPAQVLEALAQFGAAASPLHPLAIRIPAPQAAERAAPVEVTPAFLLGWFEVQDIGSQLAASLAGEIAGLRVLDFCAGGGGKTLALGAAMKNKGQIFAYDSDARRMVDIIPRAQRAGLNILKLLSPLEATPLAGLEGTMDLVFVDAPCTGAGTWRRRPDAKWRLTPDQLARRMDEQNAVLRRAADFVKPGGRLIYVTCSVLAEENEDRVGEFLKHQGGFRVAPVEGHDDIRTKAGYVRVTPLSAGTDGFFAAVLARG